MDYLKQGRQTFNTPENIRRRTDADPETRKSLLDRIMANNKRAARIGDSIKQAEACGNSREAVRLRKTLASIHMETTSIRQQYYNMG